MHNWIHCSFTYHLACYCFTDVLFLPKLCKKNNFSFFVILKKPENNDDFYGVYFSKVMKWKNTVFEGMDVFIMEQKKILCTSS